MNLRSISVATPQVWDESPTIPLRRGQPAARGFAAVLAHLDEAVLHHWEATLDDTDPEALHQLRVALRRSRSVLRAADTIFADTTLDRFSDDLRWLAGLTGPTRDLDVFIAEWHRYTDGLDKRSIAALLPVSERLHRHRRAAFETLVDGMESERAEQLVAAWTDALVEIRDGSAQIGKHGDRRLGRVVTQRITAAHRRLVKDGRAITDKSPSTALHELRKDAKRLRYLVECFGGALPKKASKHFVDRLKELQDNLGAIQDGAVHRTELEAVAAELAQEHASRTTMLALARLTDRIDSTTADARTEFAERFADFDSKGTRRVLERLVGDR